MNGSPSPDFLTLLGLVKHYSPSGAEGPAVEWLVARMAALGYSRAFVDQAGNAVGVMGTGARQVVLLGHVDTVPGEIPVRACPEPSARASGRRLVEGEVLFGRGSVDAKGSLAAFVDAVARVGPVAGWQFVIVGAVDEERDSAGARFAVSGYRPEFAIVGEPSGWERITLGYKGNAWARITARRPRRHPAGGEASACEAAIAAWEAARAWATAFNAGRERVFEQVSPVLRGMSSGEDGFEEWAGLQVQARLPPDLPPEVWYQRLGEQCAGVEVEPTGFPIPAYRAEKNTPLVRAFLAGIRAAGGRPGFVLKSGTADLNIVAPRWQCPAVAYGPGDSALDHTPNEHLSLDEYARSVAVLRDVLVRVSLHFG